LNLSRSKIASALRRGGRQRNLERRSQEIQQAMRSEQLEAPVQLSEAHGAVVAATVALVASLNRRWGMVLFNLPRTVPIRGEIRGLGS
jgi:hypothetical protein